MTRPNFFIIGAPKCGTSTLAWWLSQHPQVWFSPIKEPHFFNDDSAFRQIRTQAAYDRLFQDADEGHRAIGEASTWYLFSETAVPNIERFTDGAARYIVCLRAPVRMMPSLHRQLLFSGSKAERDVRWAWALQEARAQGRDLPPRVEEPAHLQYRRACALGAMCQRLLRRVPRERVHFVFIEDLAADPRGTYLEVLRFLRLAEEIDRIEFTAVNTGHAPRSRAFAALIALGRMLQRRLGLRTGRRILHRLRNLNRGAVTAEPLDPAFEAELRAAFADDIALLQQVTGRGLSHWLSPAHTA